MSNRLLVLFVLAFGLLCACREGKAQDGRRRIAVIPKGTTHEFWKSIHAGAESAGRQLDVEVLWKGPLREDDRDEQIKVVEDFITRRVDGIVLAPLDDAALIPCVRDAVREGIPVVIVDSDLSWDGRVSFVATDNFVGGALAARKLGELLEGAGRVLVMRYLEGSASTMKREEGFLTTLTDEFGQIEVVSSNQYSGATTEGAYRTAENLLIQFADVDGIFCSNESATFGMLRALQDAGLAGQPRFIGFDPSQKLVEALRAGELDALVIQDPVAMGDLGIRAMVDHLEGRPVEARIDTGVVVITKDDMDEPRQRALLDPDLSILER